MKAVRFHDKGDIRVDDVAAPPERLGDTDTLPHTTTTVLQDWQKGRHSEVDDLNGVVFAEAARFARSAPVNAAITTLAHLVEKGEVAPAPGNLDRLLAMLHAADGRDWARSGFQVG